MTASTLTWDVDDEDAVDLVLLLGGDLDTTWQRVGEPSVVARARWDAEHRVRSVEHWTPEGRVLDRTEFVLGAGDLMERPRPGGRAIRIPTTLSPGVIVQDSDGAGLSVEVVRVGRATLLTATGSLSGRAVTLRATMPEGAMDLTLLEGLGEVSLGPCGGPPTRQVVGWAQPEQAPE